MKLQYIDTLSGRLIELRSGIRNAISKRDENSFKSYVKKEKQYKIRGRIKDKFKKFKSKLLALNMNIRNMKNY